MTALLEGKGLKVIEVDLPERVSGMTCEVHRSGGKSSVCVIVVSKQMDVERKRFTLAHELGHRIISGVTTGDIREEKAIDRFAGAFLIPKAHLEGEFGLGRHGLAYQEIRRLKHLYGVSASAILMRLGQTGLLPEHAVTYDFRTYANAWRKTEPHPIEAENGIGVFEKPRRFETLVYRALAEELISPIRGAEMLGVPVAEVEFGLRGLRSE